MGLAFVRLEGWLLTGTLLEFQLLDPVVWAREGGFTSMRESQRDAFNEGPAK